MRGQTHARFSSHIHCFTLTEFTAARAADGKTREARRSATEYNKCWWTWPVSNQRSSDRCNMFTKQTSNTHVRGVKTVDLRLRDLWKEAWYPSWHIFEGFEGISERWDDCVPHQDCKSVSQNPSYVTRPRHPRQLWLLAGAVQGHRHWWAVFKPLTFPITFLFRAVGKSSRITIRQKNHLGPVELDTETSDVTCDFDLQQKHLSLQQASREPANFFNANLIVFSYTLRSLSFRNMTKWEKDFCTLPVSVDNHKLPVDQSDVLLMESRKAQAILSSPRR